MPGMGHSEKWWSQYHALRREGFSRESAARITNSKQGGGKKKKRKQRKSGK